MREKLKNPHDTVFKAAFSNLSIARRFFADYLPQHIASAIDWESLQQRPGSFIDPDLRNKHTDLLFSAFFRKAPIDLYFLFEHQSSPHPLMPLRLLSYLLRIWEQRTATQSAGSPLPVILPIVLYQGREPWIKSIQLYDLFQLPDSLEVHLSPFIPDFQTCLIDLPATPFQQFRTHVSVDIVLHLLKVVRERRTSEFFSQIITNLDTLLNQTNLQLLHALLTYLTDQTSDLDSNALKHKLSTISNPQIKEFIMTLGEHLRNEGRLQGKQEGRSEGRQEGEAIVLRRLLAHRFGSVPTWAEVQIQNATPQNLENWSIRTLNAKTLEAVFESRQDSTAN